MKRVLATAAAILLAGALAACGPVMRFMAGGSKHAAAGMWQTEPQLPGLAWIALNPKLNGDAVAVQHDAGLTCQHGAGTIRGNRVSLEVYKSKAVIIIETANRATLIFVDDPPPNTVRLRKKSSTRSVVCE